MQRFESWKHLMDCLGRFRLKRVPKKTPKVLQNGTQNEPKSALGAVLGSLGAVLCYFGAVLGLSWPLLGAVLGRLEHS